MRNLLRPALCLFVALSLITGLAYPLAVSGLAQLLFPHQAAGSLIVLDGRLTGSELIGQNFTDPGHFWGRPSATAPYPYNALASGGSNLGPANPQLADAVRERIARLRAADPAHASAVPAELVSASASGIDPDISLAAALYQAPRVAARRGLALAAVRELVVRTARSAPWPAQATPLVNVLRLNIALDSLAAKARAGRPVSAPGSGG